MDFSEPDERLIQLHHSHQNREIVFLANSDRKREFRFSATFRYAGKTAWRWDLETGERAPYPVGGGRNRLNIRLGPLDSLLLVFETGTAGQASPQPEPDYSKAVALGGQWVVHLEPIGAPVGERQLPVLTDLATVPGLDSFSGTATYRFEFRWDGQGPALLDLGEVRDTSEVVLNGKPLGVRLWGRHQYATGDALRNGTNTLEVKVTTTAFNYCRSFKQSAVCSYWVTRSGRKEPLPSGLIGPARIVPLARTPKMQR
jgi:hypothetical protein